MRAKRMLEILVPAASGAVLTVAVAWGVASFGETNRYTGQYHGVRSQARVPAYLRGLLAPPRDVILMPGWQWGYDQRGSECEVPGVASAPGGTALPAGWFTVWSREFGWPCSAMAWHELNFRPQYDQGSEPVIQEVFAAYAARGVWAAGVRFAEPARPGEVRRRLPLEVLGLGFAVNTAIGAGLAWMLLFAPWRVRAWRRRRRGGCVRCGYDLRGLAVCPECGGGVGGGGGGATGGVGVR